MSFFAGAISGLVTLNISPFTQAISLVTQNMQSLPGTFAAAGSEMDGTLSRTTGGLSGMSVGAMAAAGALAVVTGALAAAAAAAEAVSKAFIDTAHWADKIGDASQSLGVSTEFLSGMSRVAQDAGVSTEQFAETIKFMEKNAYEAVNGNKELIESFKKIGISMADLKSGEKNPEQLFSKMADAMAQIQTPAERTALAMQLLGRGGDVMVGLFRGGSGEMKQFASLLAELGGTVDEKTAAMADKWGKLETIVGAAWDGIKKTLAQPVLEFVSDHFEEVVGTVESLFGSLKDTIVSAWPAIKFVLEAMLSLFKALASIMSAVADAAVAINNAFGGTAVRGADAAAAQTQAAKNALGAINIDINGAGMDAKSVAELVKDKLEAYQSSQRGLAGL
jgi:phage-related protein